MKVDPRFRQARQKNYELEQIREEKRRLQEQNEALQKQITTITPQVYASIALALHRKFGWGFVRINRAFLSSQYIWAECNERDEPMIKMCFDETGIELHSDEE